jgi:hypothetical protein
VTHRQACVTSYLHYRPTHRKSTSKRHHLNDVKTPLELSLTSAISMWLLVTYVLIASASPAERTVPLCACQLPTRLRVREHLEHYQQTFLQTAAHLTSPTPLFSVASISSSYRTISNETMSELLHQPASRINTTQLADSLGGLDLARRTVDFGETNTEEQINDTSNDLVEDECPTDCGGPEQSWETNRHNCHCIGVS